MNRIFYSLFFILIFSPLFASKSTITFSADKMQGSVVKNNTNTTLMGNAIVSANEMEIKGETIKLFGKDFRFIEASGSVNGKNEKENFSFSADMIKYDRNKKQSEFFGNVKFIDKKQDVELSADYAYYDEKAETLILRFNVVIKQKKIECKSVFATYRRTTTILDLVGKPSVKKDDDIFTAERILINLDTEDIQLEGKVSGNVTEEREDNIQKSTGEQNKEVDSNKKQINTPQTNIESTIKKKDTKNE